jgi:hypothetical protein
MTEAMALEPIGTMTCPFCGCDKPHGHFETGNIRWFHIEKPLFEKIALSILITAGSMSQIIDDRMELKHRFRNTRPGGACFEYIDRTVNTAWRVWMAARGSHA